MTYAASSLVWNGLTLPQAGAITLDTLDGWEGIDARTTFVKRPASDGWFDGSVYAEGRVIVASGQCTSDRDNTLATLGATFILNGSGDVEITHGGRTLSATARLTRYRVTDVVWPAGIFRWTAELTCPDPLRYGPWSSASTGFPTATGGLVYPLYPAGVLDYGTPSDAGRVTMSNVGTAPSYPQFTIVGPVDAAGFEILEVGPSNRLRFETTVPAGSSLLIDPALGAVLIDGVADRARYLTRQTIGAIPAGASVEYAFYPLGPTSTAQMTAAMRPAYW